MSCDTPPQSMSIAQPHLGFSEVTVKSNLHEQFCKHFWKVHFVVVFIFCPPETYINFVTSQNLRVCLIEHWKYLALLQYCLASVGWFGLCKQSPTLAAFPSSLWGLRQ